MFLHLKLQLLAVNDLLLYEVEAYLYDLILISC
jgi:hypothetical protein